LAPGPRADIILLEGPIEDFTIGMVIAAGKTVFEKGRGIVGSQMPPKRPQFAYDTVNPGKISSAKFKVAAPRQFGEVDCRVIGVGEGTIITRSLERSLPIESGIVQCQPSLGINQIAAIDRHTGKGTTGLGFVEGFGLTSGAMASTYNPHYQHLLVVGANAEDMAVAAAECARLGGGFVVAERGQVVARVPMPLYGLLSEQPVDRLAEEIGAAIEALRGLGCSLQSPFHTLAFTGLPVSIGSLKISSVGLVDVWRGEVVPLFAA
jgi:adenine deaminase